jgi:dolichol-phosphate mannosyltransferase
MISVVTPIFNEEENLPELRRRLAAALDATGRPWEVIFVDDGSRDGSAAMLRKFHEEDARLKMVGLSRNFGHQPAITAGVHFARGDAVILIDGDLQDPPEIIGDMVRRWAEGWQVVLGERTGRKERGVRSIGFALFYPLMRWVTGLRMANAGVFGLMDRAVIDEFNKLPERNRFIPGLRNWLGFRQTAVPYERQERAAGQPKQTLGRLVRYALDGMISFSYKPLRIMTWAGILVAAVGFITAIVFIVRRLFFNDPAVTGFTTLLTMMMFLGGVQLIAIGVLGEYVGRIYEEVKQRPLYVVSEKVGV